MREQGLGTYMMSVVIIVFCFPGQAIDALVLLFPKLINELPSKVTIIGSSLTVSLLFFLYLHRFISDSLMRLRKQEAVNVFLSLV